MFNHYKALWRYTNQTTNHDKSSCFHCFWEAKHTIFYYSIYSNSNIVAIIISSDCCFRRSNSVIQISTKVWDRNAIRKLIMKLVSLAFSLLVQTIILLALLL